MASARYTIVTDAKGVRGVLDPQRLNTERSHVPILLQSGKEVMVPVDALVQRDNGTYYVSLSLSQLLNDQEIAADAGDHVIPVVEEQVNVSKRWVETGRVRITKRTREEEQVVTDFAAKEEVDVQRVPINKPVDGPVEARYEGDTLVIPVLEEVLVVEKRLMLKEELRVTRRKVQTAVEQPVTVRKEDVIVEHIPSDE